MSKPKVAFFDFTSCEGCQLSKLNLEDDLLDILGMVELVNFREAISDRREDYEIAFVEGSISTPHCVERIHHIRRQAKILVALGACAHIGGVNAIRNRMDIDAVKREVYGEDRYLFPSIKAQAVGDVVKVDCVVPGCPIDNQELKRTLSALFTGKLPSLPEYAVCVECKARENECLYDYGTVCMGPITRAGCSAACPSNGHYCFGCRGVLPDLNKNAAHDVMEKHKLSEHQIRNRFTMFNTNLVQLEEKRDE
ncbi:MAG TPA: NADH:ubiquinone oxidoreductase [Spirochaetia bacterium]|nr:NADH:ubiquinone oxidoreductase [Spirochaetia bacterium]